MFDSTSVPVFKVSRHLDSVPGNRQRPLLVSSNDAFELTVLLATATASFSLMTAWWQSVRSQTGPGGGPTADCIHILRLELLQALKQGIELLPETSLLSDSVKSC